jgi:succinate dehydrogenase / fumarate reductase cytochrome b subunit
MQLYPIQEAQMALNRKVGFFTGLKYKGGGPMWAWVLHRLSGLAMVIFVGMHIMVGFLSQQFGSGAWGVLYDIYTNQIFQLVLFFLVIFHAVNGLRVTILDLWPALLEYQREAIWAQWFIIIPTFGLILFAVVKHALGM